jgi:hypothetical protein
VSLRFDANDPPRLAAFWAGILGGEPVDDGRGSIGLRPSDDPGFGIRFTPTAAPKIDRNLFHFELTSTSREHQQATVTTALELGAEHLDVGQRPDEDHVVLADPEGNEFCVIEPGNNFLAGCGFLGALSGDGTRAVGCFWSEALGWPLVWDQDEETAIQSPEGGAKISWGGPPLMPKTQTTRLHLDLAPPVGGDLEAEVDRLVALGATQIDTEHDDAVGVALADPDGRELYVVRG